MSKVKVLTVDMIIELFFKISIALAMVMVILCPVLSIKPAAAFLWTGGLALPALGLPYAFSGIKTLTQKLE